MPTATGTSPPWNPSSSSTCAWSSSLSAKVDAAFERCDEISSLPDGNRELGRSDEYGDGIMKYVCYGADAEAYQAWLSAGP